MKSAYLPYEEDRNNLLDEAITRVHDVVPLQKGDFVAITFGDIVGVGGNTNTLKILQVGD